MAPFTGGICFVVNDQQYDIANDKIIDQDVKPVKRKSKWNFIRCIRRKRKSRNKKLTEEEIVPSREVLREEVDSQPKCIQKLDSPKNLVPIPHQSSNEACATDSSTLLYVENKFPAEDLSEFVVNDVLHKCISCGETKLCQKDLVEHLMKHVYEGLNAAVWLSSAISTFVNNPIELTDAHTMSNSQHPNNNL